MFYRRRKNKVKFISRIVLISFFCVLILCGTAYALLSNRVRFNGSVLAINTLPPQSTSTATWEIKNTNLQPGVQNFFEVEIVITNNDEPLTDWDIDLYTHSDITSAVCYQASSTTLTNEHIALEPYSWNQNIANGGTITLLLHVSYTTTADISHFFGNLYLNDLYIEEFTNLGGASIGDVTSPTVTLSQEAPTNGTVMLNILAIDSESCIEVLKVAEGIQVASYFLTNGTSLILTGTNQTENKTYALTKNGTYTVMAQDSGGNKAVATIIVDSLIDITPPSITLSSNPPTSNNTVDIDVWVIDSESSITTLKYANGNQVIDYFTNGGNVINVVGTRLSEAKKITITAIGTYTVYAEDAEGNRSIKTITIDSVIPDVTAPEITLTEAIPVAGRTTISITAEDNQSNIVSLKIEKGNKNLAYFEGAGTELTISGNTKSVSATYSITENDTYTVYAEDFAGNKIIETIEVTDISNNSLSTATWELEQIWNSTPYNGQIKIIVTNLDEDCTNFDLQFKLPADTTNRGATWWVETTMDTEGNVHMIPRQGYGTIANGGTIEIYMQVQCSTTNSTNFTVSDMVFNGLNLVNLTKI